MKWTIQFVQENSWNSYQMMKNLNDCNHKTCIEKGSQLFRTLFRIATMTLEWTKSNVSFGYCRASKKGFSKSSHISSLLLSFSNDCVFPLLPWHATFHPAQMNAVTYFMMTKLLFRWRKQHLQYYSALYWMGYFNNVTHDTPFCLCICARTVIGWSERRNLTISEFCLINREKIENAKLAKIWGKRETREAVNVRIRWQKWL